MADKKGGKPKAPAPRVEEGATPEEQAVLARIKELNSQGETEPKRPSYEDMQTAQAKQKEIIDKLQDQRKALREEIQRDIQAIRSSQNFGDNSAYRALLDEKQGADRQIADLIRRVGTLTQLIRKHDREKREARANFAKLKGSAASEFNTVEELETEIRRLEGSLETEGSGSIKRERRLMNTIKELEASKSVVRQQQQQEAEFAAKEEERAGYMSELEAVSAKLTQARAKKMESSENLAKSREESKPSNETEEDRIKKNKEQLDKLKEQIDAAYEKLRSIGEDYKTANKDWNEWKKAEQSRKIKIRDEQAELRRLVNARKAQEREERERAERREALAEDRLKLQNPHADEINICNQLIAHFEGMQRSENRPRPATTGTTKKKSSDDPWKGVDFGNKKGAVLKKDDDEEDWLFGSTKNKKAKKAAQKKQEDEALGIERKAQKTNRIIHLTMTRMRAFHQVGVDAPRQTDDIPNTLAELRKKRDHYETFIRSEEEVDKLLEAADAEADKIKKENASIEAQDPAEE